MSMDHFIRLRVADWEKDYIQRKAQSANMTLSEFVRRAAMHQKVNVLSGTDEEVLQELRRQGIVIPKWHSRSRPQKRCFRPCWKKLSQDNCCFGRT